MIARVITYTLSAVLWLYAFALGAELYLVAKDKVVSPAPRRPSFNTQYLHPHYFFSFPRDPSLLAQINTKEFWVDPRGFRGEGPEARGKRKLAFLLGGSTAFGDGVGKNSQTISARLNELQREYFFVNAAVPSWNSFQELLRLIKQCLPERPSLVISLDGYNDFHVALGNIHSGLPVDTPESFSFIEAYVEDIRSGEVKKAAVRDFLYEKLALENVFLSNLRKRWESGETAVYEPPSPIPTEPLRKAAQGYLANLNLMHEISTFRKIRFVSFFQPVWPLHASMHAEKKWESSEYGKFKREVISGAPEFLVDISEPFHHLPKVDHLFLDAVHFNEDGYLEVAKLILHSLKQRNIIESDIHSE